MEKVDFFISYSRNDTEKVVAFKEELERLFPNIKIWFDVDGIESGQEFISKITSAIKRSNRVLFFISDSSVSSEWTRKEVMYAKNKNIPIIPILIDENVLEENDWYLFQIGSNNYIVLDNPKQKAKLLKDISRRHKSNITKVG